MRSDATAVPASSTLFRLRGVASERVAAYRERKRELAHLVTSAATPPRPAQKSVALLASLENTEDDIASSTRTVAAYVSDIAS